MEIHGYLLDIDGTLIDSTKAHLVAWKKALRTYGVMKSNDEIKRHFGKPTRIIAQELLGNDDFMTAQRMAEEKSDYFIKSVNKIDVYPNVRAILKELANQNKKIVFASSNYNIVIEAIVKEFGWDEISQGFVGIDDITHGKPHPEMIERALKLSGTKPEESVMIGDSTYDVEAGKAAGTKTVAVCTKHSEMDWKRLKPDLIIPTFGQLALHLPLDL